MQSKTTANFRFEQLRWQQVRSRTGVRKQFVDGGLESARGTCGPCGQSWDARAGAGLDAHGPHLIVCCPHCGLGESIRANLFNPHLP